MPQIIVIADSGDGEAPVMLRERVSVSDFESEHFTTQFSERLRWAVGDADEYQRDRRGPGRSQRRAPRSASVVTTAS